MDVDGKNGRSQDRGGHYLVAVTGSVNSEYLLRWTDATARRLGAEWTALHISDPEGDDDQAGISRNMALARELGAETVSISDRDVAAAVVRYARAHKATSLVVGKTGDDALGLPGDSGIASAILESSGDLDVVLLRGKAPVKFRGRGLGLHYRRDRFRGIGYAALGLSAVTALGLLGQPVLGYRSISILYLLTVIILPFACSRAVVVASAAAGTLLWNFLFIPPKLTFSIASIEDVLMYAAFFIAAIVGGYMTSRLKEKESALSLRERRMAFLYGYSRAVSRVRGLDGIAGFTESYLGHNLGLTSRVWLNQGGAGTDRAIAGSANDENPDRAEGFDAGLAEACVRSGRSLGDGEDRLYLPLESQDAVIGALYVAGGGGKTIKGESRELLQTLAGNLALAVERESLSAENERNKMAAESARLSKILLDHVSHELRTPLTTIKGSVSGLLEGTMADDPGLRSTLLGDAMAAADRLDALVEDLLDMSRLEAGKLKPKPELIYVGELAGAAISSLGADLGSDLGGRKVELDASAKDFEIEADPALMVQVFKNILRNFGAYTTPGANMIIGAEALSDATVVRFEDDGPGVPQKELPRLFETFFRGSGGEAAKGCGLGLAICKGIVEVHGGSIKATRGRERGLVISISLPRSARS